VSIIIDNGNQSKMVSQQLVAKPKLSTKPHPNSSQLQWVKESRMIDLLNTILVEK
jgi:hypothetical protein